MKRKDIIAEEPMILPFYEIEPVECTRKRLRTMLKWFRNKKEKVRITYQYNNSMDAHVERCYVGVISSFTVETKDCIVEKDYKIKITFTNGKTVEEYLSNYWEFRGLGELQMCNEGPYCYFTVRFI